MYKWFGTIIRDFSAQDNSLRRSSCLGAEAVDLEVRGDGRVVAAVDGVGVAAVVGRREAEREPIVVELVAPEEDAVGPRGTPPETVHWRIFVRLSQLKVGKSTLW